MLRAQLEHLIRAAASVADDPDIVVIGPETAVVSAGWEARLVRISNENPRGATGWCLEPHDAVVAKLVAGREHDIEYATEAIRAGLVDRARPARRGSSAPPSASAGCRA